MNRFNSLDGETVNDEYWITISSFRAVEDIENENEEWPEDEEPWPEEGNE